MKVLIDKLSADLQTHMVVEGISQSHLAEKVGLSESMISHVMTKRVDGIRRETLKILADEMKVSPLKYVENSIEVKS